jgi:hypothetical protein
MGGIDFSTKPICVEDLRIYKLNGILLFKSIVFVFFKKRQMSKYQYVSMLNKIKNE